ncbi:DNA cytosine methyltransferase [Cloacibacillus sp.]|uniref:DNA cytosine methyltransferase n=1 Tax=Cloacibacillus sp. TaxID=2049023 RepID=UPI0025BC70FD|nr:DNA cytosine methyltransferase [Cloacibacillus sp.]
MEDKTDYESKGVWLVPVSVVDLFCGVGGLTKGLELAGMNVVAGIDLDESCKYAYESNNRARFITADVNLLDANKIIQLYPQEDIRVLVGCAPCQPFSKYTQRYRKEGHKDDKWRLLYSFSHLVDIVNPSIVSMENVPELVKETVFEDFINHLLSAGYNCSWSIVFCPDYGVPQQRKRLVLLASLLGEISLMPPLLEEKNYRTVRDAIGHLPVLRDGQIDDNDPIHCSTKMTETNLQRIRQSVPGGTWKDWDEHLRLKCHTKSTGKGYCAVYGRMCWDEPAPTITTQFYGYGNGRFGHPEQDRALSYREGALLQSFPENYVFVDKEQSFNRRELGVHIGNAVPVELARAIGISIQNHINEMGVN